MRSIKCLALLVLGMLLQTLPSAVMGETLFLQPPEAADRPSQRWLPLPRGDEIELGEQAQLLQQLRDLMSTDGGSTSLPKLDEQQLQEMEQALDELRNRLGDNKLPNLEDIPKPWIDEALANPLVRKQAQQLLEQYARDRKLPLRQKENGTKNADGVPIPRRNSSVGMPPGGTPSGISDRVPKSKVAERPDAERLDALKTLFEKLKSIESERKIGKAGDAAEDRRKVEQSSERQRLGNPTPTPSGAPAIKRKPLPAADAGPKNQPRSNSGPPQRSLDVPEQPPRGDGNRLEKLQPETLTQERLQSQKLKTVSPGETNPESDVEDGLDTSREAQPMSPDAEAYAEARSAIKPSEPKARQPVDRSALSGAKPLGNKLPPPVVNSNTSARSRQNRSLGSQNERGEKPHDDVSSSASRSGTDIKAQLERQGLGRALQSIVEKTLQEQGEVRIEKVPSSNRKVVSDKAASAAQNRADKPSPAAATTPPTRSPAQERRSQRSSDLPASNAEKSGRDARGPKTNSESSDASNVTDLGGRDLEQPPSSSNEDSGAFAAMSGLRELAAEFWGAIGSTTGENHAESGAASESTGAGQPDGKFEFEWNGRAWIWLVLFGLAMVLLLLLARKRLVMASVASQRAEAKLAKAILAEGVRTRADVVRAFHRFVLRGTQPVATWWHHRYAASRLAEASPPLRSVILDLSSVYEHARYLPPEVELSSDQLDRVHMALKQCAACGL